MLVGIVGSTIYPSMRKRPRRNAGPLFCVYIYDVLQRYAYLLLAELTYTAKTPDNLIKVFRQHGDLLAPVGLVDRNGDQ